jgi:hypothetical protein
MRSYLRTSHRKLWGGVLLSLLGAVIFLILTPKVVPTQTIICDPFSGRTALKSDSPSQTVCDEERTELSIQIRHDNFLQLSAKRKAALESGVLLTEKEDYISATFLIDGNPVKGKLRLKGDFIDHIFPARRWSLRIELKDGYLFGASSFSIQAPFTKGLDHEALFAQQVSKYNLVTPTYRVLEVKVNNIKWGTMLFIEHFAPEMIERNKRKHTFIGKFNEDDIFKNYHVYEDYGYYYNIFTAPFDLFNETSVLKDPFQKEMYIEGKSLMQAWRRGDVQLDEIVDLEKYAYFFILSDVWHGWHGVTWTNLRFYFNPYTLVFEPIPWDLATPHPDISTSISSESQLLNHLVNPEQFQKELTKAKKTIFRRMLNGREINQLAAKADRWNQLFFNDMFKGNRFDPDWLRRNAEAIRANDSSFFQDTGPTTHAPKAPDEYVHLTPVLFHLYDDGSLGLMNRYPVPGKVQITDSSGNIIADSVDLSPTELGARPIEIKIDVSNHLNQFPLTLIATHENESRSLEVTPSETLKFDVTTETDRLAAATLPDFIHIDDKKLRIPAGEWLLNSTLIIAPEYDLILEAGALIRFSRDAGIYCRGNFLVKGTADAPVQLISQTGGDTWGGIYIRQADKVHISHLEVSNSRAFHQLNFSLTGAITIYDSPTYINDTRIFDIQAEDALNVVNSEFEIIQLRINNTVSDAIDIDFSEGRLSDISISNIGGDGIDFSGSVASIKSGQIDTVRDKAISVGEASNVRVNDLSIDDAGSGFVAKDYSRLTVSASIVTNTRLADAMAFVKKPAYGAPYLEISDMESTDPHYISAPGATLIVDGVREPNVRLDVDRLYKSESMRK